MPKKTIKRKKIELKLVRNSGCIALDLKIPTDFEEFFKSLSEGKKQSSTYWFVNKTKSQPADFYKLTKSYEEIEKKFYNSFNHYGYGLIQNQKINLAPLRTIGASKGIIIYSKRFDEISNFALSFYIKELGLYTKKLYEEMIANKTITATITFEL